MADEKPTLCITVNDASKPIIINDKPAPVKQPTKGATNADTP